MNSLINKSCSFFLFYAVSVLLFGISTSPEAQARTVRWRSILDQPKDWFGSPESIRIAENVLLYQHSNGGWPKNKRMARILSEQEKQEVLRERESFNTTIDNNGTHTQIVYLAKMHQLTGNEQYAQAATRGIEYLLDAQYENGGWPQFYPPMKGYYSHITFNDGAMMGVMRALRDIANSKPEYRFVGDGLRKRCAEAVQKGIDVILNSQVQVDGKLTVWCAQHDESTLEPAQARSYELVSLSGMESVEIVRFLMQIDNPSPEIQASIEGAIAWFQDAAIHGLRVARIRDPSTERGFDKKVIEDPDAPPLWARFYEIGTNRPMFVNRDGIIQDSLDKVLYERRVGYRWLGPFASTLLDHKYPDWKKKWGHTNSHKEEMQPSALTTWPEVRQTAKPWTRWWWHGSAVDEKNITRLLETYQAAGIGGVEITCIYGVEDNEARELEYLSSEWVKALQYTLKEAKRLGMGVDLPAGSGWRMGGPSVTREDANSELVIERHNLKGGNNFAYEFKKFTPQNIIALENGGQRIDLSNFTNDNSINWKAPEGQWTIYLQGYRWSKDNVKRPAPGGEGMNINPLSKQSVANFLSYFGETLKQLDGIRTQFHDSYEYEGNWQPDFFKEFASRRGYRLEEYLPALAGDGPEELIARVKCDYRETVSDLVLENFIGQWVDWSHDHGQLARNQSHGSPANWLDLYSRCDIPETESFGRLDKGDADALVLKFASSAANVMGKKLTSSESVTWLDEHFQVTLSQMKEMIDRQILVGINHLFFHGTVYSPDDVPWPGWLFYASTQVNPLNPIWHDLPKLNSYITRCQSLLQESDSDNDVLLYWPIHDYWHDKRGLRKDIQVHNSKDWFRSYSIGDAANLLEKQGFTFDNISDKGLAASHVEDLKIATAGHIYKAIVIPKATHIPLETLEKLLDLADSGAPIIFWEHAPKSEPGMAGLSASKEWKDASEKLKQLLDAKRISVTDDLVRSLLDQEIPQEKDLRKHDLDFVRKSWKDGHLYFLKNNSGREIDQNISLSRNFEHAILLDPLSEEIGKTTLRDEKGRNAVRIRLSPGQSLFLFTTNDFTSAALWNYWKPTGKLHELRGHWDIEFLEGGPNLPESFTSETPIPWTKAPDKTAENFAGTVRYSLEFDCPNSDIKKWQLDLGDVLGSVRVRLNGEDIDTLIYPPFVVELNNLKPINNKLDLDVTGVAANRIRHLDQQGVEWRIFKDINFVNIDYGKFDASKWPIRPLGLNGPVTLQAIDSKSN